MKKLVILLAFLLVLAGCGSNAAISSAVASDAVVAETVVKVAAGLTVSEAAAKETGKAPAKEAGKAPAKEAGKAPAKETDKTTKKAVSGTNFLSTVEKNVFRKINKVRTDAGLSELTLDEDLQSAARIRSRELCKSDTFAHKRPNGTKWETVLKKDVPYVYLSAGENLCMTQYNDPSVHYASDSQFWMDEWVNSPSHYENLVRPEFNYAGVGIYSIQRDGMTYAYATMIFAQK